MSNLLPPCLLPQHKLADHQPVLWNAGLPSYHSHIPYHSSLPLPHQHIIHHGLIPPESYDTFLASSFSNHVFATISSLATANSSTISPSTFLTPYPFPPWTSSYPSASSPTCPFKSPHTITTSCSPNPSTTPPSST